MLRVLADQLALAIDNQRLAAEAAEAAALADVDAVRTALLRAVSHDLRTPLASIKAMVSGLRDPTVDWTPGQLAEALATIDEETDRLNRLVGNLLDASRLQIGALAVDLRPTDVAEMVDGGGRAVSDDRGADDRARRPDGELPAVSTDPALLERSLANLIVNAMRYSPRPPVGQGRALSSSVADVLRAGRRPRPGIPDELHAKVVAPFQRLGDAVGDGVGLGSVDRPGLRRRDGRHAHARRHTRRRAHGDHRRSRSAAAVA